MALARSSTESFRFSLERRRKRISMMPATRKFKRAKTARTHAPTRGERLGRVTK